MISRLRLVVLLSLGAAALVCATAASAATFAPAVNPSRGWAPMAHSLTAAGAPMVCNRFGQVCYAPQDLQEIYDFPTGPGAPTGAGQTIMVVTAYGAPFMAEVLQAFDAGFGLPDPPSFEVYSQQTPVADTRPSGATFHWQVETALDVEWAHAMAPGAKIVLAVAASDDALDIAQVLREALPRYPGAIVTQSFGGDEAGPTTDPAVLDQLQQLYLGALIRGGTVLAAAGDFGASDGIEYEGLEPGPMAAYPASDPLVLAVGGTMGNPSPAGLSGPSGYGAEQVWNELTPDGPAAAGGAPSVVFEAPPWQRSIMKKAAGRGVPDVSYNAAVDGGVLVAIACAPNPNDNGYTYIPESCGQRLLTNAIGGTSAGTPQWAAIVALANELRARQHRGPLGLASPALYDIARDKSSYARDFHDILVGTNGLDLRPVGAPFPPFGYDAAPGYDLASGLGTPDVANLLGDLAKRSSGEIPGNVARKPGSAKGGHGKHQRFDPSK